MTSGLAIMPLVFSNGTFCTRRTQSGADALTAGNPYVGAMNMNIAGGQILKAAEGVTSIAKESKNTLASSITSAEESIKALSKGDKVLSGIGKVMSFTADHINPLICATGAVKVLTSDDKTDSAIREGLALSTMFASEAAAKKLIGMPKTSKFNPDTMKVENDGLYELLNGEKHLVAKDGKYKIIDNNKVLITKDGLYKNNPFIDKQVSALNDYCETTKLCNKSLKFVPGMLKGLGFVCASIAGYKLGMAVADQIIGKKED